MNLYDRDPQPPICYALDEDELSDPGYQRDHKTGEYHAFGPAIHFESGYVMLPNHRGLPPFRGVHYIISKVTIAGVDYATVRLMSAQCDGCYNDPATHLTAQDVARCDACDPLEGAQ